MADDTQGAEVRDGPPRRRHEPATPDGPAIAAYERGDEILALTHTAVLPAREVYGVASSLIAEVVADVRARDLRIASACLPSRHVPIGTPASAIWSPRTLPIRLATSESPRLRLVWTSRPDEFRREGACAHRRSWGERP